MFPQAFYKRGIKRLSHVSSVMFIEGSVGGHFNPIFNAV